MPIHTVPSHDFGRDVGTAKRVAAEGPVFITQRGKPAFALLSIDDYYQLTGAQREVSLLEAMDAIPGGEGPARRLNPPSSPAGSFWVYTPSSGL